MEVQRVRHSTEVRIAEAKARIDLVNSQSLDKPDVLSEGQAEEHMNPFETVQSMQEVEIALQAKVDELQAKLQRSKLEHGKEKKHSAKL